MTTPTNELYQPLVDAYDHFNQTLFHEKLPAVIFTLQRKKNVAGFFAAQRWGNIEGGKCNEIAINPSYFANSRIIEVFQTLVHEMVHAWQFHNGTPSTGHYHNKEWAQKMIEIGLMPSTTGEPGGDIVGRQMGDFIIKEGAFLREARVLIENPQFSLMWVDRLALPRLSEPVIADLKMNKQDGIKPEPNKDELQALANSACESESLYSYFSAITTEQDKPANESLPSDFFISNSEVARKPSRYKYECPNCSTKIYGRLGLNIMCCDCNTKFVSD
ncbi:SprT-like domain-containing protein [uncultured Alteromonas sp.]|uniref:SprT-like domain-containing protein n=1 Tax=uncultured Alteromonas sp. TaxID=179113 RepID=UPI0025EE2074|nr:SprT-like domain-containing protein [uncultured Alteromonas sp.]